MQTFLDANRKRKILAVDDEPINLAIIGEVLAHDYEVAFASDGKEALELLSDREADYSLVLLDLMMPVMDGFEVIRRMKADDRLRKFPIIVMTSDKSAEVRSLRMGAADFITKPYDMPEVILARCEAIIELSEDRSIIRSTERDPLTGLYSKEYFFVYIRRFLTQLAGSSDALVLNFDRFSLVNELFGREEGDRVLKKTAELIDTIILQSHGIACRADGDIFYIYCKHRENYEQCVKEIQDTLNRETQVHTLHLRCGLYEPGSGDMIPESWFDRAKTACDNIRGRYSQSIGRYSRELYERFVHKKLLTERITPPEIPRDVLNSAKSIQVKLGFTDDFAIKFTSSGSLPLFEHCDQTFLVNTK